MLKAILQFFFPALVLGSNLSGYLTGTLGVENSPYIVIADIRIAAGDSLHIEPGVTLKFASTTSFIIEGKLIAEGTEEDSIYYTSNEETPTAGDWPGIYFNAQSSGRMSYSEIKFANVGIRCTDAAPRIQKSTFSQNSTGIDFLDNSTAILEECFVFGNRNAGIRVVEANPLIRKNVLQNNSFNGFESALVLQNSAGTIVQNFIWQNTNSGIDLLFSDSTKIYNNTIVQNDLGITISSCNPSIVNNIIAMNGTGLATEDSAPFIAYNTIAINMGGNFITPPPGLGVNTQVNARNDSCDANFNILLDPYFFNPNSGDFRIQMGSPCIDTGDAANPGEVWIAGLAPDMGAYENNGVIVPVELVAFYFFDNQLFWRTATESSNSGFYVQRASSRSGPFENLAFVEGAGTTGEPHYYAHPILPVRATSYFRLAQVDFDGTTSFSEVIQVENEFPFHLLKNYPNPFSPKLHHETTIDFLLPKPSPTSIKIYDLRGRHVNTLHDSQLAAGRHQLFWDGRDRFGQVVASGAYLIVLESNAGSTSQLIQIIR